MPAHPTALLEEYLALIRREKVATLSPEDAQRVELLRDVLLELGALPAGGGPTRALRADAVLEVSFATKDEAVRAYSKNIGAGGIAISTARPLAVGATVQLRIQLPQQAEVALVEGKVAWSKADAMGVAFDKIRPQDEARLKELLIRDEGVLGRVRSVLNADVRDLAARGKSVLTADVKDLAAKGREVLTTDLRELGASKPKPAAASEVDTRPFVQVLLGDEKFAAVLIEVLAQAGFRAVAGPVPIAPAVIIADTSTALAASEAKVKFVLINVSGPDALAGRLTHVKPSAFVKRPASAAMITEAVATLLGVAR